MRAHNGITAEPPKPEDYIVRAPGVPGDVGMRDRYKAELSVPRRATFMPTLHSAAGSTRSIIAKPNAQCFHSRTAYIRNYSVRAAIVPRPTIRMRRRAGCRGSGRSGQHTYRPDAAPPWAIEPWKCGAGANGSGRAALTRSIQYKTAARMPPMQCAAPPAMRKSAI